MGTTAGGGFSPPAGRRITTPDGAPGVVFLAILDKQPKCAISKYE